MADTDGLGVEAWDIPFEDLDFGNLIGKGNFGCVWAGEYVGTPVAIKKVEQQGVDKLAPEYVLDKETALKYFLRELSVLKSIHHPNVVQFMGTSMSTDAVFLVTEWVNGGDLRKLIKKKQIPVTWKERAEIARDTAIAMAYLHYKKLIHRDLKPANLLLTENGRVKVCDLGLARTIEATEKGEGKKYYTIAGTDVWMAPEVILGDAYDFKCDVFSFGCVLYCLIKRHSPPPRKPQYGFGFDPEVMLADIPAKCPKEMVEMMKECLETEPEKRPNFRDLAMRLKKLVTELPENDEEEEQKTIEIDGVHVEIESIIKIQEEKVKETSRPPSMEKLPIPRDLPPPVLDEEPPKKQQPQQPQQPQHPQPVKEEPKTPQHVSKVVTTPAHTPTPTPTSPTEREALTPRSKEEEEHMALLMSSGGSRYGEEEVRNTRFALLFKAVREKEDKMKNKKDEEEQPQPAATGAPTGKKNDDMRNKRFAALFSMVNEKDL